MPSWVAVADLGSDPEHAARLERMAGENAVSYLRFEHAGPWNKGLAFNSAIVHLPEEPFIFQLDADVVAHPYLLDLVAYTLSRVDGLAFVASYAQAPIDGYDGSVRAFGELLALSRWSTPWSFGGSYLLPRDWLLEDGGMDEAEVGWGFADSGLWLRAERTLRTYTETSGSFAVHQPHPRQPGASTFATNPNWERFQRRRATKDHTRTGGFGAATLGRATLREGIRPALRPSEPVGAGHAVRAMRRGRLTQTVVAAPPPERPGGGTSAGVAV